jgi:hypothetical protein
MTTIHPLNSFELFGLLHFQLFCNGDDGGAFYVLYGSFVCIGSYIYMYFGRRKVFHKLAYFPA